MKAARQYCLPVILFMAMIACSNTDHQIIDEDLLDVVWRVDTLQTPDGKFVRGLDSLIIIMQLYDSSRVAHLAERSMTIQFMEDIQIDVTPVCNTCGGTYEISRNGNLRIEVGGCTEIACGWGFPGPSFTDALENITVYEVTEDRLTLYDSAHQYEINLSIGALDEELLDVIWKIDSLQTPDGKIVVGPDTLMTIQFFNNRGFKAVTSCRASQGFYVIAEDGSFTIIFAHGGGWVRSCTGRPYFLRTSFFSGLENLSSYNVGAGKLTLFNSNRTNILSFSILE